MTTPPWLGMKDLTLLLDNWQVAHKVTELTVDRGKEFARYFVGYAFGFFKNGLSRLLGRVKYLTGIYTEEKYESPWTWEAEAFILLHIRGASADRLPEIRKQLEVVFKDESINIY